MPNLHDIEKRINSVQSTKQITRTMEMVSAAKIRSAGERVWNALPWSLNISEMLINTAKHAPRSAEALLADRDEIKKTLIVVITSDRGLAGGFSTNVIRAAERIMKQKQAEGVEVEIVACGKKAITYFNYRGIEPVLEFRDLSADPTYDEATEISEYSGDGYHYDRLDEVILIYNHAKNAAEQTVIEQKVLPIDYTAFADVLGLTKKEEDVLAPYRTPEGETHYEEVDVDFEPSPEYVLQHLMPAYLRNMYYYALIDSAAAEQAARRSAMKSATDNATEMVDTLNRLYNRVRQSAITTEISEIVGGAAALED